MDAKIAVRKHEKNMHPGKKPTKLAKGGNTQTVKTRGTGAATKGTHSSKKLG